MDKKLNEILEILKELMEFPSVSKEKEKTNELLEIIKNKYIKKDLYVKKHIFNGFSSLVISNTNEEDYDIVFCTHIDVVPCEEYAYKSDDENIYGRGSMDMKGQVAVCISVFNEIETDKKIALFITSDEEIDGACAKELVKIYPNIKLAIVPDGGKDFNLIIEEKGLLQIKISAETKTSHASQPYNGVNAITTLFECYQKIIEIYPLPKSSEDYKTSVTLSKIEGGSALNMVPGQATMYLDIRHVALDKKEDIINKIKGINKNLNLEVINSGTEFVSNPDNPNIKEFLIKCKEVLGYEPKQIKAEATSDAIYFYQKGIPTVLINPIGDNPHCPNEYVNKKSLLALYNIFIKVIKEGEIK